MKIINFIVLLFCIIHLSASAQEFSQITNVYNRNTVSLNGKWSYIIDQAEIGNKRKFWEDRQVENRTELLEYNFQTAQQINVPGDWNSQQAELKYYEGKIWYQKSFQFEKKPGKRYFIYFGAVNYQAEVYLNGEKLGTHQGGFNPFNFEITDLIRNENSLVVSVDNTREKEQIPTIICDWKNFGGITRDVFIIEENKTFVQDFFLQLKKGSKDELKFNVTLNGNHGSGKVTLNIPELEIRKEFQVEGNYGEVFIKVKKPELWTPDSPKLYAVNIQYNDATLSDKIGFRSIEVDGTNILLNGETVFLRGIAFHEESPLTGRRTSSAEEARMMLNWAQELGCNFVRLSHYPHNEYIVRLADEMGLMLWEEIPVYWDIDWNNTKTLELAKQMLGDVINRDKNRAAVVIWSVANETEISESRNEFLKHLIDFSRVKDETRLVSAALLVHEDGTNVNKRVVDDPLGNYTDIISVNQYAGWYGDVLPNFCEELEWEIKFEKPFMFSEFGAGALGGFHADSLTRWSEEYQEWYYKETLKMCDRIEQLRGISPWSLVDYQSPRRQLATFQDGYNRKGIISNEGKKKKAFFILKDFYDNKK